MLSNIRPILAAVESIGVPRREHAEAAVKPLPFVTLSSEPGIDAAAVARDLVGRLNEHVGSARPWTAWDREQMGEVAADLTVADRIIDTLEEANHSWLNDLFAGLSVTNRRDTSEAAVFARTAATVRALATAGHVVIVGRGGVFLTHKMPAAIHVRLVAPHERRVQDLAHHRKIRPEVADGQLRELERNQQVFFRRYFPERSMDASSFTAWLNVATLPRPTLLQVLQTLVQAE
jgi:cytidylate kinase